MLSKIYVFLKFIIFHYFSLTFQEVTGIVSKNVLHFRESNFFTPCLKTPDLFLGEPLGFRISSDVFTVDPICSFDCFFTVCQVLCFCVATVSAMDLREYFFTLRCFLLVFLPHIWHNLLLWKLSWAGSSALKVAGFPTEVQNIGPDQLFKSHSVQQLYGT